MRHSLVRTLASMFVALVVLGATVTLMASAAGPAHAQPFLSNCYEEPVA